MRIHSSRIRLYGQILERKSDSAHHRHTDESVWMISLHGFMQSGHTLAPVLSQLDQRITVFLPDIAGHGRSEACRDSMRFQPEYLISDLMRWMDLLQLDKVYLHGYSMGGRLCWQLLKWLRTQSAELQARFQGMIIESAHPGFTQEGAKVERKKLDEQRATEIEKDFKAFYSSWTKQELFNGSEEPDPGHERLHDPASYAACLRGFGNGNLEAITPEELEVNRIPLLLLAGRRDQSYVDLLRSMAESSDHIDFIEVPDAGHRCWQDRPDIWVEQVNRFVFDPHVQTK